MILNIIIFIVVLGVLVLIHEFGHFVAAKKFGMVVEEFGIGYPPRIFGKTFRDTKYSINLFPLGGFVKIKGEQYEEDEEAKKDKRLFYNRPLHLRMITVIAGVLMNLIFGWFVIWLGFSFGFPSLTRDMSKIEGAQVIKQNVLVASIFTNSPADKAGIKPGDTLVSSGSTKFLTIEDVLKFTHKNKGKDITLNILTNKGQIKKVDVILSKDPKAPLGISIIPDNLVKFPVWQAAWESVKETGSIAKLTGQAIIQLLKDLFTRGKISEQISGPVGIYQGVSRAASIGFVPVVMIAVLLSINLALINLVPFPALDGGKLAFLLIEAIFRKRVIAVHIEQAIETVGFFLLILFILAVTYKDIIRIG